MDNRKKFKRKSLSQKVNISNKKSKDRERAKEISKRTGIPLQSAIYVVKGKTTVDDVLKSMLRKEKMKNLIDQHHFDLALAGQVVRGTLTLEKALLVKRLKEHPKFNSRRSFLDEALKNKLLVSIALYNEHWKTGYIQDNYKYEFLFKELNQNESKTIDKHELKLMFPEKYKEFVINVLKIDSEIQKLGLSFEPHIKSRFKIENSQLIDYIDTASQIKVILRQGEEITGKINWFSKWEINLRINDDFDLTIFRHSLFDLKQK